MNGVPRQDPPKARRQRRKERTVGRRCRECGAPVYAVGGFRVAARGLVCGPCDRADRDRACGALEAAG